MNQNNPPTRIYELVVWLNENPDRVQECVDSSALKILLNHAIRTSQKFLLPDGAPYNYKFDPAPYAMTAVNLNNELRRFYVFCRADVRTVQRESIFIELLTGLTKPECELLIAVKDQKLDLLYPNIPYKKLAQHYGWDDLVVNEPIVQSTTPVVDTVDLVAADLPTVAASQDVVYEAHSTDPSKVVRVEPNGRRQVGRIINGIFRALAGRPKVVKQMGVS